MVSKKMVWEPSSVYPSIICVEINITSESTTFQRPNLKNLNNNIPTRTFPHIFLPFQYLVHSYLQHIPRTYAIELIIISHFL